eukprot:TRINITY_DN19667_c0_g1_i2.p1 TRINITY_DN19667_c0_g1~~TRINITY_DN19667_c0_g1_i2.p1  ORF type:complete len:111 (-),score=3.49 TRINITY_DN19667_c0_g1_i2:77-409(-)
MRPPQEWAETPRLLRRQRRRISSGNTNSSRTKRSFKICSSQSHSLTASAIGKRKVSTDGKGHTSRATACNEIYTQLEEPMTRDQGIDMHASTLYKRINVHTRAARSTRDA